LLYQGVFIAKFGDYIIQEEKKISGVALLYNTIGKGHDIAILWQGLTILVGFWNFPIFSLVSE
jgi:hypothetical protein